MKKFLKNNLFLFVAAIIFIIVASHFVWSHTRDNHIAKSEQYSYTYVASSQRDIYHTPTCRWANKIAIYNLIGFETEGAARKSGRRACKVCNP